MVLSTEAKGQQGSPHGGELSYQWLPSWKMQGLGPLFSGTQHCSCKAGAFGCLVGFFNLYFCSVSQMSNKGQDPCFWLR